MYIDINKNQVEEVNEIVTTREEFEAGGFVILTEALAQALEEDPDLDILEYLFPSEEPEPITIPDIVYLKKGIGVITIQGGLTPGFYTIGDTWEDYEAGKYVQLTDEQVAWYNEHKAATPEEIFNMDIPAGGPDIESIRKGKLAEIDSYDRSSAVNSVIINGMSTWLTAAERANYNSSISAAESFGMEDVSFFVGTTELTVSVVQAKQMLAAVQLYADACFIVTAQHKIAVSQLTDVDAILNYDYTVGYPERPSFNLQRSNAPAQPAQ